MVEPGHHHDRLKPRETVCRPAGHEPSMFIPWMSHVLSMHAEMSCSHVASSLRGDRATGSSASTCWREFTQNAFRSRGGSLSTERKKCPVRISSSRVARSINQNPSRPASTAHHRSMFFNTDSIMSRVSGDSDSMARPASWLVHPTSWHVFERGADIFTSL